MVADGTPSIRRMPSRRTSIFECFDAAFAGRARRRDTCKVGEKTQAVLTQLTASLAVDPSSGDASTLRRRIS
jgi:hypothetical protein